MDIEQQHAHNSAPSVREAIQQSPIPTPHEQYYLSDGNIVLQVENTLFKVHRFFLEYYSTALRDMCNLPQGDNCVDSAETKTVVLSGDKVQGWQILFSLIYRGHLLSIAKLSSQELSELLRIAHKYAMKTVEEEILAEMEKSMTTDELVHLMVASEIVGSDSLYQKALHGLTRSKPELSLAQARLLGVEAVHAIYSAAPSSLGGPSGTIYCSTCDHGNTTIKCAKCGRWMSL